jgi:cation diffusion facilitator CzcD-associated flavoprotein CzcO
MPPVPLPTGRNAKPRVVIIGAGFGGLAVARGLAHSGATVTQLSTARTITSSSRYSTR